MEKNKTKNSLKLLYFMAVVCIATLVSAIILFSTASTNTLAQSVSVFNKGMGAIVEDYDTAISMYNSDCNLTGKPDVGAVDVSSMSQYCFRDEYVLYTQDQSSNGLCWAFTGATVLGTTAMKATGEYYDFSEAWVGLARTKQTNGTYVMGDGGNTSIFNSCLNKYGVVLESDFEYQNSFLVSNESYDEAFDYYSQFANTSFMDDYKLVCYYFNPDSDDPTDRLYKPAVFQQIKSHIYNHGAVALSLEWTSTAWSTNRKYSYKIPDDEYGDGGSHAVTAIGWDDNIEITYNSKTYKGAWICQNSWGNTSSNDGIFYVCYDDDIAYHYLSGGIASPKTCYIYGYIYEPNEADYEEPTSLYCYSQVKNGTGYNYTTNLKGKYYLATQFTPSSNSTKQKNVFFNKDINITYKFTMSDGANLNEVSVFKGDTDVTNKFTVQMNNTTKEVTLTATNVSKGAYKVLTSYSLNSESAQNLDVFYVVDGTEVERVYYINSYSDNSISNNGYYQLYNSMNSSDLTINIVTDKKSSTKELFYYYGSTYSTVDTGSLTISYEGLESDGDVTTKYINIECSNGKTSSIKVNFVLKQSESNVFTNFFYKLNGGQNTTSSGEPNGNLKRVITSTTAGATLASPNRDGYVFAGWYYDSALTQPLTNGTSGYIFDYDNIIQMGTNPTLFATSTYNNYLSNSNVAYVYAKWIEDVPSLAHLSINNEKQSAGTEFSITAVVDHALARKIRLVDITWHKRVYGTSSFESVTQAQPSLTLTQTINQQNAFEYYADLTVELEGNTYTLTTDQNQDTTQTDNLTVYVIKPFETQISYSNGKYAFTAVDDATKYVAQVYCVKQAGDIAIGNPVEILSGSGLEFDLKSAIASAGATVSDGEYYAKINAVLSVGNKNFSTQTIESSHVNFYKVKFVTDSSNTINDLVIDEFTTYVNPNSESLSKTGYTFEYWCSDAQMLNKYDAGETIASNLTIYAKWKLNAIQNISSIGGVNKAYDGVQSTITLLPSHESGLTEGFSFAWYFTPAGSSQTQALNNTSNQIAPINAKDSGVYYCNVTLTDARGRTVTTQTNNISVNIEKFQTVLDTQNVIKQYTYNGSEQTINSGAVALDSNNNPIGLAINYQIQGLSGNKFVNVPQNSNGSYVVIISTSGNENFKPAQAQVQVVVKKATPIIQIEKPFQFFSYTGESIVPEFVVNNQEQKGLAYTNVSAINVGEYDVTITVIETQNYLSGTADVHITINPANIFIKANDISGVLFEAQKELSYSIISGQVYGNDDLGIVISTDVNTSKIGDYTITLSCNNSNYKIAVFEGRYYVSGWPYYLGAMLVAFATYLVLLALSKRKYQYEFEVNGGSIVAPIDTKRKREIRLDVPTKDGYKFAGWYLDIELTKPFKGRFRKSKGKTLYAKWEKDDATIPLSEELQSAQQIVEELGFGTKQKRKTKTTQDKKSVEKQVDKKPKEKTDQEKLEDLINSISASTNSTNTQDLDDLINNITQ